MWLPLALSLAVAPAAKAGKTAPAPAAQPTPPVVEAAPPPPPPPPPEPAPVAVPAPAPVPVVEASVPAPAHAAHPMQVGLELGLDVPSSSRMPMASTRIETGMRLPLPDGAFTTLGVRTGYSYVSGETAVADPALGVDAHALLMAHRIPLRLVGRLGWHGDHAPVVDAPIDAGVLASGGVDVVMVQAQSFGRSTGADPITQVGPSSSIGGFLDVAMGDGMAWGLVGEWDFAQADLAALTPGIPGDLSSLRLALSLTLRFG